MLKSLAMSLALVLAAVLPCSAHAEPIGLQFTYTGFYHEEDARWVPDYSFWGYFIVDDRDRDGVFEREEVSSFIINNQEHVGGCGEASICGLWVFSYVPGGALNFHATWGYLDSETNVALASGHVQSGVEAQTIFISPERSYTNTYSWRPETVFWITPVPEPASAAMLALGLATICLARRARPIPPTRARHGRSR